MEKLANPMQCRFLCFNIHGGRSMDGKRDLSRVNALLDSMNIDVGVFQEMETRSSRRGKLEDIHTLAGPDRPYHFAGPSITEDSGWYGNLIVSRFPIIWSRVHNLETKPNFQPRNAIDVLIQTPNAILRVVGTHLSLSLVERWSEARNLLRLVRMVEKHNDYPLFLMGDINEWQFPSKLLRYLNKEMTAVPCRPTFPSFFPIFRLDRVWYDSKDILSVRAKVLSDPPIRKLSDHLPVFVQAEFSGDTI
jgi:endonuclease/exonuclease/phosphatase family metal-dependent hydrolase